MGNEGPEFIPYEGGGGVGMVDYCEGTV